mmetsp:Transcript_23909/g.74424  ORF Transcript_23909/g.74424 Transcript_23909/m.74424 type:complete len:342 (+) Transcript_23909:25-1050(+)
MAAHSGLLTALLLGPALANGAAMSRTAYSTIRSASVVNPKDGSTQPALSDMPPSSHSLVVLLPQLGEFDSCEMCEHLVAVLDDLERADMELRVIGIGSASAAKRFADFNGLPLPYLRVDPEGRLHAALGLHAGPAWSWPKWVPDVVLEVLLSSLPGGIPSPDSGFELREVADAWLRYLAMCAGVAAPGTLPEILRGYLGDRSAPERLRPDEVVTAGFVQIGPGVGPVSIGPISYENAWAEEAGYQRPVELATVRLKNMVEALGNWDEYVSNPTQIARRGATFIFEEPSGECIYEYRHRGVLTYSETMRRPLSFLAPFIGNDRAANPLGMGDAAAHETPQSG